MRYRTRINYSESQKALMWDRWQKGDSLHDIARLFDRGHSSISRILAETGGIRPPQRQRSSLALTLAEREEISRGIATQSSVRSIAIRLSRSPSTVSREINHNGSYHHYRATSAEGAAWQRTLRPKTCKLAGNHRLIRIIAKKLKLRGSSLPVRN
jgi:IS30 family transposase